MVAVLAIAAAAAGPVRGQNSNPITCTLEDVGKVLCSDGSIYATASAASADSKTAVAMITYLDVTTHKGLAMSLTDVNTGSFCFQTDETCLANQYGAADVALGDMDGLANTTALVAHATHEHGAAHVAANYNVARPEGASAWFLPSAGQWDRMVTAAGGYESLESELGLASDYYWSSSERNFYNAWAISFASQTWGNYTKTNTRRVRACFEFDANIPVPHTVRLAAGTEEAGNWSIASGNALVPGTQVLENVMSGSQVTATYNGTSKKVKSVKAVKYLAPVTVTTAPTATEGDIVVGSTTALVNAGAANGGTMMYAVTTTNAQPASTADFSATIPTAQSITTPGTYYVWYYAKADADHSDSEIAGPVSVTLIDAPPSTLNIEGETFYYVPGENWAQAIANHPENAGWTISSSRVWNSGLLLVDGGWSPVNSGNQINPNETYHLESDY